MKYLSGAAAFAAQRVFVLERSLEMPFHTRFQRRSFGSGTTTGRRSGTMAALGS